MAKSETLGFGSKHTKSETLRERLLWGGGDKEKARRRSRGRGVLALLSRSRFAGSHGRHVNAGKQEHPSIGVAAQLTHEGNVHAMRRSLSPAEAQVGRPPQAALEALVVPEASQIRPEVPTEAVAAPRLASEVTYTGKHRRPETLEESDAAVQEARRFAESLALPADAHRDPDSFKPEAQNTLADNTVTGSEFHFAGQDVEPASHFAEGISGSGLWGMPQRTPGERYNPAEDVSQLGPRTLGEQGITQHDNSVYTAPVAPQNAHEPKPAANDWFGNSARPRHQ